MICVINKRQMGHSRSRRQEIVCLFLMVLMVLHLLEECSCIGSDSARFARLRGTGNGSKNIPVKSRSGFGRRNGDHKDIKGSSDDVFDDDKRKIHTGPNPLHNK
ncbi:hypothetical protein AQUCO_00400746v1 [Aquilegia coerulea]|uniref:Uncharacterized protein n=1 Tax=Aquilegia coerulea TaxID=218851 RepID=A0A2G5EWH0_AQUCA|nr:hypothetical protein AQUCO_00400746v1 [Aquilegia coerulea]